jgi:hypothetical protein
MCNIMLALNDCPKGGGGTSLVPGSHKSFVEHPGYAEGSPQRGWKNRSAPVALRDGGQTTEGGFMDGAVGVSQSPRRIDAASIDHDSICARAQMVSLCMRRFLK